MAITIAADTLGYNYPNGEYHQGPYKFTPVAVTFDSSYPTGGETVRVDGSPISARERIVGFIPTGALDAASAAYIPYYIPSTEKLLLMVGAAGVNVEVTNATDLSAIILYGMLVSWG